MTSDLPDIVPEAKLLLRLVNPDRADAIIKYLDDRRSRRELRFQALAAAAETESGVSFGKLMDQATHGDSKSDLTEQVLQHATKTSAEWKMRALGRALALGLIADDDARVDEAQLMLTALADLEAPHIKVLGRLHAEGDRHHGVADYQLAAMFPNGVTIMYSLLKTLERHGLAGPLETTGSTASFQNPDGVVTWAIWDFGIMLIERLIQEGIGATPLDPGYSGI